VQAFIYQAFQGEWSVDPSVETSAWWGLNLPALDGEMTEPKNLTSGAFRGGFKIECAFHYRLWCFKL
jgi:hypothetical protein